MYSTDLKTSIEALESEKNYFTERLKSASNPVLRDEFEQLIFRIALAINKLNKLLEMQ